MTSFCGKKREAKSKLSKQIKGNIGQCVIDYFDHNWRDTLKRILF